MAVLFPITDPSRAADIRMRRRRAVLLLGAIAIVPYLWLRDEAPKSRANVHHQVVVTVDHDREAPSDDIVSRHIPAESLAVVLPCANSISIQPDPAMHDEIVLSASEQESRSITVEPGNGIVQSRDCSGSADVTIRAPIAMPLAVTEVRQQDIQIGAFMGPVVLKSTGSGTIRLDQAATLSIDALASGDIVVGSVSGRLTANLNGSGDLQVREGTLPILELTRRGSSNAEMENVSILGGRATLNGSGDLRLGTVSGSFAVETYGSGDVVVDRIAADRLTMRAIGSGDISVGPGTITQLDTERRGAGDLSITAKIAKGRLFHRGDGNISVPFGATVVRED